MDERDEAFWSQVNMAGECWLWMGSRADTGYGRFYHPDFKPYMMAHRFAYLSRKGMIPEGYEVHHVCKTRACVRPDHLMAVDKPTHVRLDGGFMAAKAAQTECVNGHPYTPDNTGRNLNGTRYCKACNRDHANSWYERLGRARRLARLGRTA